MWNHLSGLSDSLEPQKIDAATEAGVMMLHASAEYVPSVLLVGCPLLKPVSFKEKRAHECLMFTANLLVLHFLAVEGF